MLGAAPPKIAVLATVLHLALVVCAVQQLCPQARPFSPLSSLGARGTTGKGEPQPIASMPATPGPALGVWSCVGREGKG